MDVRFVVVDDGISVGEFPSWNVAYDFFLDLIEDYGCDPFASDIKFSPYALVWFSVLGHDGLDPHTVELFIDERCCNV